MPGDHPFFPPEQRYGLELNRKFLDAAGAAGLKAFVRDRRIEDIIGENVVPLSAGAMQSLDAVIAATRGIRRWRVTL